MHATAHQANDYEVLVGRGGWGTSEHHTKPLSTTAAVATHCTHMCIHTYVYTHGAAAAHTVPVVNLSEAAAWNDDRVGQGDEGGAIVVDGRRGVAAEFPP